MKKTLVGSLIMKEKITTTTAKAKEIRPVVEKLITRAKRISKDETKKVALIREIAKDVPLVAAKKLVGDFSKKFEGRSGGYTRIIKLGRRRSDSAEMAVIEFV